ncbi:glutaminyl-peptide cyclotransferase [Sungkyunkwania multivorans]|uniref:Glutaminyl-peptide cyclotransferase n=1 Tax=Sungkyunkwania multivorans TaxID=1173618 RepID=A0ABW3CXU7_9FLAO
MKFFNLFILFILTIVLANCGGDKKSKISSFTIELVGKKSSFQLGESVSLEIKNPKGKTIDSVQFSLEGRSILETFSITDQKLGEKILTATVFSEGNVEKTTKKVTLLSNTAPKIYTFHVLNEFPHDRDAFTQGLEFYNGYLYEGTGQRGRSSLRKIDHTKGEILKQVALSERYFGEGITILNDKLYQLTWQSKTGFVYDPETLEKLSSFAYGKSREGWGLCNDGKVIYKSDGTEKIWTLDPETLVEKGFIQIYTNKAKIKSVNELEYANGKIYANIWQKNGVAVIDPSNGAVEAVVDFSALKKRVTQHDNLDVLNGVAYNPDTNTFFVTGKNWDKLFEVEIVVE